MVWPPWRGVPWRRSVIGAVATRHHARHLYARMLYQYRVIFGIIQYLYSLSAVSLTAHTRTRTHSHRPECGDTLTTVSLSLAHTQSPHDSKTTAAWPQIKPQASQPRVRGWRRPTVADGRIGRPPWSTRRAPRRPSTGTPVTTGSHDHGSTEEMSGRGNTHSPCATHEVARGSSC